MFCSKQCPDSINEKTEVLHGKMQDQLISANNGNRTLFRSAAHAAFYSCPSLEDRCLLRKAGASL